MAVAPYRAGQWLGWGNIGNPSPASFNTSAAASWWALSFVADSARTLSTARLYVSNVTGTLGASDVTCDLYDSTGTGGAPGSSIETGKLPSAAITAAGWYSFTGFTTALTAGQQYWLVVKNVNGTPASNFPQMRMIDSLVNGTLLGSSLNRQQWANGTSTNSGTTWSLGSTGNTLRVGYADGSFDGLCANAVAAAGVGDGVYSARESGVKFTTPPNGVLKVLGLAMFVSAETGTPTGSPRLGLWSGASPSLLAYTNTIPATAVGGSQWLYSYFSSVQTLQPGTAVRVTLGETTQSDASTNRYNNREFIWDSDSNSLALLPWEGTCVKTYFDGTNWTDTSGSIFAHALLLDTSGEFGPGTGGSSGSVVGPSNVLI